MSAISSKLVTGVLIVAALSAAGTSIADDEHFYESLPEVSIGKVFFSPAQRARLDQRRGTATPTSSGGTPASGSTRRPGTDDAAGFIISSKGSSKVYANGDFVSVRKRVAVKFPGSVKIVRSQDTPEAEASDEAD